MTDKKLGKDIVITVNGKPLVYSESGFTYTVKHRKESVYQNVRPENFHRELWPDEVDHSPENSLSCSHTWESYEGIYDSFDYCRHCDKKRN